MLASHWKLDGPSINTSLTPRPHHARIAKNRLAIDDGLTAAQRDTRHLVIRLLGDLYWGMSRSRWKDEAFWPSFRGALRGEHSSLTEDGLRKAQDFNSRRYRYQGIGRYAPTAAYARGIADFLFYPIDTPLRRFVVSDPHLVRHCSAIRATVGSRRPLPRYEANIRPSHSL